MANKRMFTKQIIDTDAFLDMPLSSQALYFHLNMRADDDGFIDNPKRVMRLIGSNQNDIDVLLAKRFILAFESGVIVIKHWRMHNTIRKDRYTPTVYSDELKQLTLKNNDSYTELNQISNNGNHLATKRQPLGNPDIDLDLGLDIDIDIDKEHKILFGQKNENDESKTIAKTIAKTENEMLFDKFWNVYPKKVGKKNAIDWFNKKHKGFIVDEMLVEKMVAKINEYVIKGQWTDEKKQYIPHPQTWLNRMGWEDEVISDKKNKQKDILDYIDNL